MQRKVPVFAGMFLSRKTGGRLRVHYDTCVLTACRLCTVEAASFRRARAWSEFLAADFCEILESGDKLMVAHPINTTNSSAKLGTIFFELLLREVVEKGRNRWRALSDTQPSISTENTWVLKAEVSRFSN